MADATSRPAQWPLCLYAVKFDTVHRAGIKYQSVHVLWRLETGVWDYTNINDDIPVTVIDPIEVICEGSKASSYTVCQVCDSDDQELGNMMTELHFYVKKQ